MSSTVQQDHSSPSKTHPRVARALAVQDLIARHPDIQAASIVDSCDNRLSVQARLATISYKTNSAKTYIQSFTVQEEGDGSLAVTEAAMVPRSDEVKMSTELHAGVWTVNFRATTVKGTEKRFIEILHAESGVYDDIDVTDIHGDYLSSWHWGEPAWLGSERLLVYTAEQHSANWKENDKPYTAYEYEPKLGEQMSTNARTGLFLLDFSSQESKAKVWAILPKNLDASKGIIFRQPAVAPRQSRDELIQVYAVGTSCLPDGRRLGAIWCDNRPDDLYQITISATDPSNVTAKAITSSDRSARNPRIFRWEQENFLVYLTNRRGYEHAACATLHKRSLPLRDQEDCCTDILVDAVRIPDEQRSNSFPGLYTIPRLPHACMVAAAGNTGAPAKPHLVLTSIWGPRTTVVTIDLQDGSVEDHGLEEMLSYELLGTNNASHVLAKRSGLVQAPELVVGKLSASPQPHIDWKVIKTWHYDFADEKHFKGVNTLYSTIVRLPGCKHTEALVISGFPLDNTANLPRRMYQNRILSGVPGSDGNHIPPLLINPHGGPGDTEISAWNAGDSLSWVAAGYTVALINYPGSTGFGQECLESLAKDCGNLDVLACLEMKRYLEKIGIASDAKGKRVAIGHSHSGFIGAHLSVRWPEEFDAINLGNPVIDLPSNFASSDIPDWSLEHFGIKYDFSKPPAYLTGEETAELRSRSANYHAMKLFNETELPCVTPTQLILGADDLRAPPSQGIAWYHCLKGHGEQVKLLLFPENGHPLSELRAIPKTLEARVDFLVRHSRFD